MSLKIAFCEHANVEELVKFIDEHWKKDHVFVKNRQLLDWQHKNKNGYNFVLAIDNNIIIGILGFIPTSQYSELLIDNNEIWLAIWKVKEGVNKPGLGLMMLNFLKKNFNNPSICAIGLSRQVIPIYKTLKYEVGTLEHRAFFNQSISDFAISDPQGAHKVDCLIKNIEFQIDLACEIDNLPFCFNPRKDIVYLKNRYFNHPSYIYKALTFSEGGKFISLVVFREIKLGKSRIARIVDMVGSNITDPIFNAAISKFLDDNNLEYIDFVSNINCFSRSGFIKNSEKLIIPNYFSPYLYENVDIDYAYKSESIQTIFIGDSDQDRPNI